MQKNYWNNKLCTVPLIFVVGLHLPSNNIKIQKKKKLPECRNSIVYKERDVIKKELVLLLYNFAV